MAISTTLNSILEFIGYGLPPVGAIEMYAGTTAPSGWLKCDGSAVSRTTYPKLFDAIGTTYGVGDGSTTFNLPNMGGKVAVGADSTYTLGSTGGEKTHKLVQNELPKVSGSVQVKAYKTPDNNKASLLTGASGAFSTEESASTGYGLNVTTSSGIGTYFLRVGFGNNEGHNNMQPYVALNYIIRAT